MVNSNGVLIVSVYGIGHWMAARLARQGIPTTLIDVSEKVGSWVAEEVEGPFGFFQDSGLDESYAERLMEDDSSQEVKNGFSIWLKSGPLELKGSVTAHRMKQLAVSSLVQDYILNPSNDLERKVKNLSYAENWLAQVAHSYASNCFVANAKAMGIAKPSSLFTTFSIRMPTRKGHRRSLDWCQRMGVKVIEKSTIKDISLKDRKNIRGLEMKEDQSEKTQHIECDQLIWCLSSEETGMMGENLQQIFFPQGALESDWCWTRYRLKISEGRIRDELPLHTLLIDDLGKPFTHDNFVSLLKTESPGFFDAWMRLPTVQRFNKSYLEMRGTELITYLMNRMVDLRVDVANYPLGHEHTYNQIGPTRQPIYNSKAKAAWRAANFNNLAFDSVEMREGLGLQHQISRQTKIVAELEQWWKKVLVKMNKNQEAGASA